LSLAGFHILTQCGQIELGVDLRLAKPPPSVEDEADDQHRSPEHGSQIPTAICPSVVSVLLPVEKATFLVREFDGRPLLHQGFTALLEVNSDLLKSLDLHM
jgi:hypothetical protein